MTLNGAKAYLEDDYDDVVVFSTSSTLYELDKDLLKYMKTSFFRWYCENAEEFIESLYDTKKYVSNKNIEWDSDGERDVHGRIILDTYDIESCEKAYNDYMSNVETLEKFEQFLNNEGITLDVTDYCIYNSEKNDKETVKTGYFFKEVMEDETELPTYTNEKLYATPKELVWGILEKVMEDEFEILCSQRDESNEHITPEVDVKEYESIRDDVLDQIKHCKDALSVCLQIKDCLRVYEQTEELFIDIAYTSVF